MDKYKMLIVEDDPSLGLIVKDFFERRGYHVVYCQNAEDAYKAFSKDSFDIILLDVILPGKSGFDLASQIREINKEVPVIFLTAQTMKDDIVKGFTVGADDYIKKPFVMEELVLRVNAILRRSGVIPGQEKGENKQFFIGEYEFLYDVQKLKYQDKTIELTHKESELLKMFCENLNNVIDRKYALNKIWEDDSFFNSRSMDVYVAKLRKYLAMDSRVEIVNIRGKGFKLRINKPGQ